MQVANRSLQDPWGRSSVGRVSEWHSEGRRFDPDRLHQEVRNNFVPGFFFLSVVAFFPFMYNISCMYIANPTMEGALL